MRAVGYYITLPILRLISALPFPLIYKISDAFYLLNNAILNYRKNVVFSNLKNSFPEKSDQELREIQKAFYQHFFDLIMEIVKARTITPNQLKNRVVFNDTSIFKKYQNQGKSILVVMGHFGNWELSGARFALESLQPLNIVYKPLSNQYFNQYIYKMRARFGNQLYPMNSIIRSMIQDVSRTTATVCIADQTPTPENAYWFNFLNQDTPFHTGIGKIAKKFNYPVVFVSVQKLKRGYYSIDATEICTNPENASAKEIVERYAQQLELDIQNSPATWLWSHRRWKHKRNPVTA